MTPRGGGWPRRRLRRLACSGIFVSPEPATETTASRRPGATENMGKKLFVGNLNFKTNDDDLRTLFSQAGTCESATVMMDRATGRSRGFGFVEMSSDEEALKAVQQFNGYDFQGRNLNVNEARERTPGRSAPRRLQRRRRVCGRRRSRRLWRRRRRRGGTAAVAASAGWRRLRRRRRRLRWRLRRRLRQWRRRRRQLQAAQGRRQPPRSARQEAQPLSPPGESQYRSKTRIRPSLGPFITGMRRRGRRPISLPRSSPASTTAFHPL